MHSGSLFLGSTEELSHSTTRDPGPGTRIPAEEGKPGPCTSPRRSEDVCGPRRVLCTGSDAEEPRPSVSVRPSDQAWAPWEWGLMAPERSGMKVWGTEEAVLLSGSQLNPMFPLHRFPGHKPTFASRVGERCRCGVRRSRIHTVVGTSLREPSPTPPLASSAHTVPSKAPLCLPAPHLQKGT